MESTAHQGPHQGCVHKQVWFIYNKGPHSRQTVGCFQSGELLES